VFFPQEQQERAMAMIYFHNMAGYQAGCYGKWFPQHTLNVVLKSGLVPVFNEDIPTGVMRYCQAAVGSKITLEVKSKTVQSFPKYQWTQTLAGDYHFYILESQRVLGFNHWHSWPLNFTTSADGTPPL
jgi:hypothetical protein